MRGPVLCVALVLAAGCSSLQPCRSSTLFVDLTAAAPGADQLAIDVSYGGATLHGSLAYGGQPSTSFVISFPGGYPRGQTVR